MLKDRRVNNRKLCNNQGISKQTKSTFTCKYFNSDIPSEIIKKSDLKPTFDK